MNIYNKLINYLEMIPDKEFTSKLDYSDRQNLESYIRDRRNKAMKPIQEKRDITQARAKENEAKLEEKIVVWAKNPKNLYAGLRIKLKGTRDAGYRKVHSINGEQVIGFQFYYQRRLDKKIVLIDKTSTTSNHIEREINKAK